MTTHRQVDEPSPTIVGPSPRGQTPEVPRQGEAVAVPGQGGKVAIPQGMERLMTLAGINAEWRGRILADPLAAAAEARIELSDSERVILNSIPRPALEGMAASFARRHGGVAVGRLAGAAAAVALLASSAYAGEIPSAPGGIRSDEPGPKRPVGMETEGGIRPDIPEEARPVLWMTSLEDALAQAKKDNRAVMAVFPHPNPDKDTAPALPNAGISATAAGVSIEQRSQKVLLTEGKEFRAAVKNANLVAVKITQPVRPTDKNADKLTEEDKRLAEAYEKAVKGYQAALTKYGLESKKLPAVVWLAPDGSELAKLVQPDDEPIFVKTIGEVPPKLAKWITEQRRREEGQSVTDGIRPDEPVTKGSRPDIPGGKL